MRWGIKWAERSRELLVKKHPQPGRFDSCAGGLMGAFIRFAQSTHPVHTTISISFDGLCLPTSLSNEVSRFAREKSANSGFRMKLNVLIFR